MEREEVEVRSVQSRLASGGPAVEKKRSAPLSRASGTHSPCFCSRSWARTSREEVVCWAIPEKLSRSSRLVNSAARGPAWLPREERKREEVSGVCRLSTGVEGEEWRGREGAELGGRPPPDIHSPLKHVLAGVMRNRERWGRKQSRECVCTFIHLPLVYC